MIKRLIANLNKYDKNQAKTLNDEMFLVDIKDNTIGKIDKHTAHKNSWNYSPDGHPHRAFSIFLFDQSENLLVQQRSAKKITFPLHWTNTCCGHPIKHDYQEGIIKEAIDRLLYEIGIEINPLTFRSELIAKVLYRAKADDYWGEYELDYLIFIKATQKVNWKINFEEVQDVNWVNRDNLLDFVKNTEKVTPWFRKIVQQTEFLQWWKTFMTKNLETFNPENIIFLKQDA